MGMYKGDEALYALRKQRGVIGGKKDFVQVHKDLKESRKKRAARSKRAEYLSRLANRGIS